MRTLDNTPKASQHDAAEHEFSALVTALRSVPVVAPPVGLGERVMVGLNAQHFLAARPAPSLSFSAREIGVAFFLCGLAHAGLGAALLFTGFLAASPLVWLKGQPPLLFAAAALFLISGLALFRRLSWSATLAVGTVATYLAVVLGNAALLRASLPDSRLVAQLAVYQLAALALGVLLLLALNRFQNEPSHKRYCHEA